MGKNCYICGDKTIFYVWTTSRYFPRDKLIKLKKLNNKYAMAGISLEGQPVCFRCYNEMKEHED